MKLQIYQCIAKKLDSCKGDIGSTITETAKQYKCAHNTILAIYTQLVQKKLKKLSYVHCDPHVQADHLKRYSQSETDKSDDLIYKLAIEVGIPPVMLAKMIIELLIAHNELSSGHILKNINLIEDEKLRLQVKYCLDNDTTFGPSIDIIKKSIGEEYEHVLKDKLKFMKIPFKDENILRDQGYDKTPDLLLSVPIAINNTVVNWIESKASFGDEVTHKQYLREQYWSYWNRFGSGLVIYWFGYIDELSEQVIEKGILIMDHLPYKVMTLH